MTERQTLRLPADLLVQLGTTDVDTGLALLNKHGMATAETASALVETALERAESATESAAHWLEIAVALEHKTGESPSLQAQIYYARARIHLQQGDLQQSERALRKAQGRWRALGDESALARSDLGLTQVLTLQGRFDEAEAAIRQAIARLPHNTIQLVWAYENLANLLGRRGQYEAALQTYDLARTILVARLNDAAEDDLERIGSEIVTLDINRANALVALDRPHEAEQAYRRALAHLSRYEDTLNRGRVETNLGSLYLRMGRYAAAMEAFHRAEHDLLGDTLLVSPLDPTRLRRADILLLDQANAYLALNLLAEAAATLERCQDLFRGADQPYELGQSLYLLGLLRLREENWAAAEQCLMEAQALFAGIANLPWYNRTELALAMLDEHRGASSDAAVRLDRLLAALDRGGDGGSQSAWDLSMAVEAQLLRIQLLLNLGDADGARRMAIHITDALAETVPLPHLQLRLEHALGSIELEEGNLEAARHHLYCALNLLEAQRTSLPLEEFRTAYLADKFHIYSSLVLSLLDGADPTTQRLAEAFAVMERARARALLERLQTTITAHGDQAGDQMAETAQQEHLYSKLHWLYNQWFSSRAPSQQLDQDLRDYEMTLERLAWKSAQPLPGLNDDAVLTHTQPVSLARFQQSLAADQQALIYYLVEPSRQDRHLGGAEGEVLAFLVDRKQVHAMRRLCTPAVLRQAQDELRFQLGRADLGSDYLARHGDRLISTLHTALHDLYQLLVAPLAPHLHATQLLFVPHGSLHLLPFHALWDGEQYLLERFTCLYAPSASVAAHCAQKDTSTFAYRSLAGLALTDPAIPQARREVQLAAEHFERSWLYLGEAADRAGLIQAAAQADILHVATHGLFRPDNPFFSALKLADGWIDVRAIYQLPLAARLVVLSACESGSGKVRGGDEVIGLARGFLGAGARDLLVSLWNVHDERAVELMDDFYGHLITGMAPPAALRAAQRTAIQQGQHPYFWASFLSIGA